MTTSASTIEEPPSIRLANAERSQAAPVSERPENTRLFTRPYLVLIGIQLSFGFAFSVFFLLPKYLTVELHAAPDAVGVVTATAVIAAVLFVPFIGQIIDRAARRPLILIGTLVTAITSLGFMAVERIGVPIYLLRLIQGAAFSLVFNAAATLVTECCPPARMSQALGLFGAAALSMNAFAPAVSEAIADKHGWAPVFFLSAVAGLIAAGLSFLVKERPSHARTSAAATRASTWTELASGLRYAFSDGRGRIFYVCSVSGAAFGAVFTFVGPFALQLGAARVAMFFVGYTTAALFVRIVLGNAADRYGRRKVAIGALALYGSVVLALSLLTPGLLFVFGAFVGVAHGMFYPALNAMAIRASDATRRGTVMSYFSGAFNAGFTASVVPCGFVARHFGYKAVFIATGLVALSAVYSLAKTRPSG